MGGPKRPGKEDIERNEGIRRDEDDGIVSRYRLRGPLESLDGEVPAPVFRAVERGSAALYFLYRGDERLPNAPEPTGSLIDPDSLLGRARAVADLDDDAFMSLYDYGSIGNSGRAFVCWPYEPGETLRARVERAPVDLLEGLYLASRVAEALELLHRAGWEHGCLRPATVFQTSLGAIRLPAAALEPIDLWLNHTQDLATAGWAAAAYLAPEQLPRLSSDPAPSTSAPSSSTSSEASSPEDLPRNRPDHRSDIWALGILLYEITSGRLPFQGRSFEAMARSIRGTLPEPFSPIPGQVPAEFERVLEGCLAQDPAARYGSMEAVLVDLRALCKDLELETRPRPAAGRIARSSPVEQELPVNDSRPEPKAPEPSFQGLLDHLARRRELIDQEPALALWQLLLPPAFLLVLVITVLWLFLR